MALFTPIMARSAVAKTTGFIIGIIGFFAVRAMMPDADPMLAWAVLALWITIGGVVGIIGVVDRIPLFDLPLYPALRGGMMGGWFTFLAILFGYDMIAQGVSQLTFLPAGFQSPWWMIVDGVFIAAIIDIVISRAFPRAGEVYGAPQPQ